MCIRDRNNTQATPYYQESTDTYRFLVNPKKEFSIKGTSVSYTHLHSIYIAKCNRVEGIINTFTDYIAQIDLEIKELINQAPVIAHQMDLLLSLIHISI